VNEVIRLNPKQMFYREWFRDEEGLISLLLIANPFSYLPLIDGMDRQALLVVEKVDPDRETEHWMKDDARILVRRVTKETLESWLVMGENRNVVHWLVQGDILLDRDQYLTELRGKLIEWSPLLREQKLLCEFSRFSRTYLQAKQDLKDGQLLDAYSNVLASLHYWAHIALIGQGMHPELTVWEQIRMVNPGVYKLYEELTTVGQETLEQRVELVLLACEFSLLTQMESSCALLIRLVGSRLEPWSPAELRQHLDLSGLSLDLSLLLQKLAKRGCIREVARPAKMRNNGLMELRYTALESF
jgi:hypothetical protein